MEYLSRITYTVMGAVNYFAAPIAYINKSDIHVLVGGVESSFSWLDSQTVQLPEIPAVGTVVEIYRDTAKKERLVEFRDGSFLPEESMNLDSKQHFMISQEAYDLAMKSLIESRDTIATASEAHAIAEAARDESAEALNITSGMQESVNSAAEAAQEAAETAAEALLTAAESSHAHTNKNSLDLISCTDGTFMYGDTELARADLGNVDMSGYAATSGSNIEVEAYRTLLGIPEAEESIAANAAGITSQGSAITAVESRVGLLEEGNLSLALNCGNVDLTGNADLLYKMDSTTVGFKVGGDYPNLILTDKNGVTYEISSIADLSLMVDGTYNIFIDIADLTLAGDTYTAVATAVSGTFYQTKYDPQDITHQLVGSLINTDGVLSGFSSDNYAIANTDTADSPWELKLVFTTGANVATQQCLVGDPSGVPYNGLYIFLDNYTLTFGISSTGTSWDVANAVGTYTPLINTQYYVKLIFTGTSYDLYVSTDDETYENVGSVTSSLIKVNNENFLGYYGYGESSPFLGSIDTNESYIKVDGDVWQDISVKPNTLQKTDDNFDWQNFNAVCIGECTKSSTDIADIETRFYNQNGFVPNSRDIMRMNTLSRKYINLTLGAAGASYIAPANGYVCFLKRSTGSGQVGWVAVKNIQTLTYSSGSGQDVGGVLPVERGDLFYVGYSGSGQTTRFRFVYLEGEL